MNQEGSMSADNTTQVGSLNSSSLLIQLETIINDIADLSQTLSLYPVLKKGIESPDYSDKLKKINKKIKSLEEAIPKNVLEDVENLLSDYAKLENLSQYLKIQNSTSNLLQNLNNSTIQDKIKSFISSEDVDLTGYVKNEQLDSFVTEVAANSTYQKKSDFNNTISNYLTEEESDSKYATSDQLNTLSTDLNSSIENEVATQLAEKVNTTQGLLDTLDAISNQINENTVSDILEIQNYKTQINEELYNWVEYTELSEVLESVVVCNQPSDNHHSLYGGPFHNDDVFSHYKTRIYNVTPDTVLKINTEYINGMQSKYRVGCFYRIGANDTIEIVNASSNNPFDIGFTENGSFEVTVPNDATYLAVTRHNNYDPGVYVWSSNISNLQHQLETNISNLQQQLENVKPSLEVYKTIGTFNDQQLDVYTINYNDGLGNSYTFFFRKWLQNQNLFDYNYVNCEQVNYVNPDAVHYNLGHYLLANTNTDIIGPVLIDDNIDDNIKGSWYGGAHLSEQKHITAKTKSYSVKVDGAEVSFEKPIQGNVCEIIIVNELGDYDNSGDLSTLLLTETRVYTIIKNKMRVRVTHEFANNAVGKTIALYYGMQANQKANDKILTLCGKHPNFIPNTDRRTFTKSEFPKFQKFVLRSEQSETKDITTSVWLNPNYGIGNHCYISDNDPIFVSAYSSNPTVNTEKSYHVLIKNLPITEGLIYSWEGVYTFENDSDLHVTEYYSDLTNNN